MGRRSNSRVESLVLGFILILLGSLFLLHNVADINVFPHIWKLWPLILIVLGASHLLRRVRRPAREPHTGQAGFAVPRPRRGRGREIALVAMVILVGLAISSIGGREDSGGSSFGVIISSDEQSAERRQEQPLDLAPGDRLRLTNDYGPVTVRADGAAEARLSCRFTVTAGSEEAAEAALGRAEITVDPADGALDVSCRLPGAPDGSRLVAELELLVPRDLSLLLESRNGDVLVSGLRGDVEVLGAGDAVTVREIAGAVSVTTGRGDITLEGIDGPVTAVSRGGDISVAECDEDLKLENSGGDVDCATVRGRSVIDFRDGTLVLSGARGPLELKVADAKAKFAEISGPLTLEGENCGLSLTNCYGLVSLSGNSLNVETANLWGDLFIDCTESAIRLENTLSSLEARVDQGSLATTGKLQQARITGDYTPITVGGCEGLLEIVSRQGDVTLRHPEPRPGSHVSVTATGGDIVLRLSPERCDYSLKMTAVSGMITSVVTGLEVTSLDAPLGEEEGTLVGVARCGSGEQLIELRTEYADIRLDSID